MRGAIPLSHRLSITICCLTARNTFEDPKFRSAVSTQPIGITVLEMCLNERILHNIDTAGTVRYVTFACLVLPYVTLVVETASKTL